MKALKLFGLATLFQLSVFTWGQTTAEGQLDLPDSTFITGNLLILNPSDSSLISGQYLSKSDFKIESDLKSFLLKIRMIGFKDQLYLIDKSTNLGVIKLEEQNLDEITITAEKLSFQNSNGNPKINLKNSVFSNAASFRELIQKMPGVELQGEEINIVGRGTAKIFVDGIETSLIAANSLSATQIESIEIVKKPDASIHADGMALIKITLNKQKENGITGTVMTHYTKAFYHLGYVDFATQFKYGKWSFNLGGNCNFGQTGLSRNSDNYLNRNDTENQIISRYRQRVALNGVSNWVGGFQYHINDNHSFGIQYNGNISDYNLDVQTDLENFFQDSMSTIVATADAKTFESSHRLSFNYSGNLDSLGSNIFIGFNYNNLPSFYTDTVIEKMYAENYEDSMLTISNGDNNVSLYTGQFDYLKKFKKNHSIKVGAKYNYSNLNSNIGLISSNNLDQRNNYFEHVIGAYIQGHLNFEKIQLNIGFRSEFTRSKAMEEIESNQFIDTSYFSFFPYLDLTLPTEKWNFTTKFSSNIERPSFDDMTPYVYYVNSMFGVIGNPYVRPGLTYGIEQQFLAKESGTSINIGYRYTKNAEVTVPLAQENGVAQTVYQIVNLKRKEDIYLELNQSLSFKNLYLYLSSTISFEKYTDDIISLDHRINFPKVYLYGYFKYSIPKWFNIEVFGSLTSGYSDGIVQFQTQGDIGLAISRSFFKDKFLVQITGNDIFQTAKARVNIGVNGDQYRAMITDDTRYIRVALTYRFGKLKESKYEHKSIDDDIKNRAN